MIEYVPLIVFVTMPVLVAGVVCWIKWYKPYLIYPGDDFT